MYAIVGMGEETQNIETPCMLFETRQDAEGYLSQIPWLHRCANNSVLDDADREETTLYVIPEGLYDEPVPPALLTTLSRKLNGRAKEKLTYGKAAGMHFFTYYNDRCKRISYYVLMPVKPGEAFVGFAGER
jgi:hypothetical protein